MSPSPGDTVYYVEEINGKLHDREAEVLADEPPICAVCKEPEQGHARPGRRHPFTPMEGTLALRVTFPANRRRGLEAEVVVYTHVPPGDGPNQWHT